jgi:hypothetical protein
MDYSCCDQFPSGRSDWTNVDFVTDQIRRDWTFER